MATRPMDSEAPMVESVMHPEGNLVCNSIPNNDCPLVADWIGEQLRHVG
jgi:hypothetical protein